MYPTTSSQSLKAILKLIEAGPPRCHCRLPRDHVCGSDEAHPPCLPDDYCACCLEECNCRVVAHLCPDLRDWLKGIEENWPVLLLVSDPAEYLDPPEPADVILSPDIDCRVELMRARFERGESVFERKQLHLPALEELARAALEPAPGHSPRGPNGNDVTVGPIGLEQAVRHGS